MNMRVAETEAAQTAMPEELEADVEDGKLGETHRFTSASLGGVEGFNSKEIEKPEPENAECPKSSMLTPRDPDPDAVDMDHIGRITNSYPESMDPYRIIPLITESYPYTKFHPNMGYDSVICHCLGYDLVRIRTCYSGLLEWPTCRYS